jgi:hypothetical protein
MWRLGSKRHVAALPSYSLAWFTMVAPLFKMCCLAPFVETLTKIVKDIALYKSLSSCYAVQNMLQLNHPWIAEEERIANSIYFSLPSILLKSHF